MVIMDIIIVIYSRTSLIRTPTDGENLFALSGVRINRVRTNEVHCIGYSDNLAINTVSPQFSLYPLSTLQWIHNIRIPSGW